MREKINENQKIPGSPPGLSNLKKDIFTDGNDDEGGHGYPERKFGALVEVAGEVEDGNEGKVFDDDDGVEDGCAEPRPSLLQVEEAEAVDDADDGVVETLLPQRRTEVGVLPDDPAGHDQPVNN